MISVTSKNIKDKLKICKILNKFNKKKFFLPGGKFNVIIWSVSGPNDCKINIFQTVNYFYTFFLSFNNALYIRIILTVIYKLLVITLTTFVKHLRYLQNLHLLFRSCISRLINVSKYLLS